MPIILYLGGNLKEYEKKSEGIIRGHISEGCFRCEQCLKPMARHSSYMHEIKETGQRIEITIVWCRACKKWHALLPDFLMPNKHYSGNEIESVIIDSATEPVSHIDTTASESTVRRWIKQIGEKIKQAVGILKLLFGRSGQAVSEIAIDPGPCYSELEQLLEMAPSPIKYSGNKLGMANIWLGANDLPAFI
jgi:hypothetical protein